VIEILVDILVYTTPTCPYCHETKNFIHKLGAHFKEVDVSMDPKAARDLIIKSGQIGVPVIDVDGEIIVGFNREFIETILKKKGFITSNQS
jgi:glutaredoxin-like YruB-family protein